MALKGNIRMTQKVAHLLIRPFCISRSSPFFINRSIYGIAEISPPKKLNNKKTLGEMKHLEHHSTKTDSQEVTIHFEALTSFNLTPSKQLPPVGSGFPPRNGACRPIAQRRVHSIDLRPGLDDTLIKC